MTLPGPFGTPSRLTATAVAAVAAFRAASRRPDLAVLPLAVAIGAEAMRAHPEAHQQALGTGPAVVHLTAASLWVGTLLYALRTMRLRGGGRDVLVRYARMAAWVYAALVVTGTASTLRGLPLDAVLTTAYGRLLLVKLALFGGASLLALAARGRMLSGGNAQAAGQAGYQIWGPIFFCEPFGSTRPDVIVLWGRA